MCDDLLLLLLSGFSLWLWEFESGVRRWPSRLLGAGQNFSQLLWASHSSTSLFTVLVCAFGLLQLSSIISDSSACKCLTNTYFLEVFRTVQVPSKPFEWGLPGTHQAGQMVTALWGEALGKL